MLFVRGECLARDPFSTLAEPSNRQVTSALTLPKCRHLESERRDKEKKKKKSEIINVFSTRIYQSEITIRDFFTLDRYTLIMS